jgi:predicted RNase H-like HicB family nuclease
MSVYRVVAKQDESGNWIAHVPEIPGCHTFARSLWALKPRIREALSLWVDDSDDAELVLDVALPQKVVRAVARAQDAQDAAVRAAQGWKKAISRSVKELERAGYSRRDTADLLGLSHQRVQQIASEAR